MPPESPTILGAFATSFVALIGLITWILRTQILQQQKIVDSLPEQQRLFAEKLEAINQRHSDNLERLAKSYELSQSRIGDSVVKLADATLHTAEAVADHTRAVDRHADKVLISSQHPARTAPA